MRTTFARSDAPSRVYWEVTRACGFACRHCGTEATHRAEADELDTAAGIRLLEQLSVANPRPAVVLTGGDPVERADLVALIVAARAFGLRVSVSASATPALTQTVIRSLRDSGVDAISLSLDGSTADRHDGLARVGGTFARAVAAAAHAREVDLAFEVNTLVTAETVLDVPDVERLVRQLGAARWSLFFPVTVDGATVLEPIDVSSADELLVWVAGRGMSRSGPAIAPAEAPFYRSIVGDCGAAPRKGDAAGAREDGGVMFIGHDGDVFPSGFLAGSSGNVLRDHPLALYRKSATIRALRKADSALRRCGRCQVRNACGGPRTRPWARTGDTPGVARHEPS